MKNLPFATAMSCKNQDSNIHTAVMIIDRSITAIRPRYYWENCAEEDRDAYLKFHILISALSSAKEIDDVWNALGYLELREALVSVSMKVYTSELERKYLLFFLAYIDDYFRSIFVEESPEFYDQYMSAGITP